MLPPHFNYNLQDVNGKHVAELKFTRSSDNHMSPPGHTPDEPRNGTISLLMSKSDAEALKEIGNLAGVLGHGSKILGSEEIKIYTGSTTPDALMAFIPRYFEGNEMVAPGTTKDFQEHLQKQTAAFARSREGIMSSNENVVAAAKEAGARLGGLGVFYSTQQEHHPAQENAGVARDISRVVIQNGKG